MSKKEYQLSIKEMPSIFSSSIEHISFRNDISFNQPEEDHLYFLRNADGFKIQELSVKQSSSEDLAKLELKRCTSFEEILIENHKNILFESMRDYFQKISHTIIQDYQKRDFRIGKHISQRQKKIERIIRQNQKIPEKFQNDILCRLENNIDEANILYEMMTFCPEDLELEVLCLLFHILVECDSLIQKFKKYNISRELKEKSKKLVLELRQVDYLSGLFKSNCSMELTAYFQTLVDKWMITLFLMKIGVFENELQTKSIDQCLKSSVFKEISLNDLLNQHLIKPQKKVKRQ